ncbi:MAG: choice-of-anchor A family protein [Lachnospiraceae bacterium]
MALNFFIANDSNVFIFNNHTQSNASATGKVYVFGDALYNQYNVGADLPIGSGPMFFNLLIAGNVNITGGTNYSQDTGYDASTGSITNYTMTNLNGAPNQPRKTALSTKIYATDFLYCSSIGWASIDTAGTQMVNGTSLTLTGTSSTSNSFIIDSTNVAGSGKNISDITSVNLAVPTGSTVIVSMSGTSITLNPFTTLQNGVPITKAQAAYVLWNFPEATAIMINSTIYGAFLAPYATVNSTAVSIYGTLMANNLTGSINAVNNLFAGELPELYNPSFTHTCSSFTTTSSTTTTTTTTTTSSTTTTASTTTAPLPWEQAITDLIESVALEQTALSHILNAEGEKIQKIIAIGTSADVLKANASVKNMTESITRLELVLQDKLALFSCSICSKERI